MLAGNKSSRAGQASLWVRDWLLPVLSLGLTSAVVILIQRLLAFRCGVVCECLSLWRWLALSFGHAIVVGLQQCMVHLVIDEL